MISLISLGLAIRATPPSARIIAGHALQRHHGNRTGFFCYARLFNVHHVHDHAAFQHLGEARFQAKAGGGWGCLQGCRRCR